MTSLGELRDRIDRIDRELVRILAERVEICKEVAAVKERSDTPVIQPARVRDVMTSRRQWAIDAGIDPDFVEQVVRVLLSETHRIEVAGSRPDAPPEKPAATSRQSPLDTVATRVDHVVVAVHDLDAAVTLFVDRLGFHRGELAGGDAAGIVTVVAGGVTIVLVGAAAGREVAAYLDAHGSGVQHIAVEVLNARFARASMEAADAALLTDVVVDDHGHEQFFTVHDPASGMQLGFISRTGHRVGVSAANVLSLFRSL